VKHSLSVVALLGFVQSGAREVFGQAIERSPEPMSLTSNVADPGISPVHDDLTGLPRLLLIGGDQEVLLDDTLRVEAKARDAGVDVEVCVARYATTFH
jgi:acetyl esterase/lipase